MSADDYVVLSKNEIEFRKWEIEMTGQDVQDLIMNGDVFKKLCNKTIHKIQSDLGMLQYVGKESEAYISINAIKLLMTSMDKTTWAYKEYIEAIEAKKEEDI